MNGTSAKYVITVIVTCSNFLPTPGGTYLTFHCNQDMEDAAAASAATDGPAWMVGKRPATGPTGAVQKQPRKDEGGGEAKLLKQLTMVTAKLSLSTAREQAETAAMVEEVWEVNNAADIMAVALKAGVDYDTEQKRLHELKDQGNEVDLSKLGHPYLQVWSSTVKYLQAHGEQKVKEVYGTYWAAMQKMEAPEEMMKDVRHFRAKKNKGKGSEKGRISFHFEPMSDDAKHLREGLVMQLKHEGAVRKCGSKPRGPLEREASELLTKLNKK